MCSFILRNYDILRFLIIFRFDTEKQLWKSCKSTQLSEFNCGAVELNGKIYVAIDSNFFFYDPTSGLWAKRANFKTAEADQPWLAKSNGLLYAIESNWTIHRYNANKNAWTTVIEFNGNVEIQIPKIQI